MVTLFIIALTCYALASIAFLLAILGKKDILNIPAKLLSICGFAVLNLIILVAYTSEIQTSQGSTYLFVITWFLSIATLIAWYKMKNAMLFLAASPIFFILLHTAMLRYHELVPQSESMFSGALFTIHIISLLIAIIILFTAGIAGILFLVQEKAMKKKKFKQYKHIPPLELLDKVNYYATVAGFPAYTIGIICGFLWASSMWGNAFSADIKEIISLLTWAGYAVLFHMRVGLSMKGKKPATLLILLCILSLFSLLAVNTLFDTHHQF